MIKEIKNILKEGGAPVMEDNTPIIVEEAVEAKEEEILVEEKAEAVEEPAAEEVPEVPAEEPVVAEEEPAIVEEPIEPAAEEPALVQAYNLDEITEYVELKSQYEALQTTYTEVCAERDTLQADVAELRAFKANIEKLEKQAMIDKFYMLSEEDKADVQNNIDTYSLEDIEAKLSILCVRNKVSFDLDNDKLPTQTVYHLETPTVNTAAMPEWVKALKRNQH